MARSKVRNISQVTYLNLDNYDLKIVAVQCQFRLPPSFPSPGALATVGALTFGILQFKRGNVAKSQLAMRMRVVAQGGTVVALVLGVLFSSTGTSSKSLKLSTCLLN